MTILSFRAPKSARNPPRPRDTRPVRQYYVYLVTNEWRNVIYTGVSNSLERRTWQHGHKVHRGFTSNYNCDILVYYEIFEDIRQAIAREKQIKSWSRAKKNALVEKMNPSWKELAKGWFER